MKLRALLIAAILIAPLAPWIGSSLGSNLEACCCASEEGPSCAELSGSCLCSGEEPPIVPPAPIDRPARSSEREQTSSWIGQLTAPSTLVGIDGSGGRRCAALSAHAPIVSQTMRAQLCIWIL